MNHKVHPMNPRMIIPASAAACLLVSSALGVAAGAAEKTAGYQVLATHVLGGEGGWDLLAVDAAARRIYLSRATRTMVVDADNGKLVGEIPGAGVHGIAVVPDTNRGFITNGKSDSVTIFDLTTMAVIGQVKAGKKPDAVIYDPASRHIFVCNNGGTDLTVLSPTDGQVQATIEVGGVPELLALDGGHLYTNLEDKDEVASVDTKTLMLAAHWPLAPGKGPTGLACDAEHHRLFSACRESRTMQVLDIDSGKVIASLPIGAGADGAVYDPIARDLFCPNGDGTLSVIHEETPATFSVVQTVVTKPGARTIAFDEKTRHLILVTAEAKPTAEDGQKRARPQYLPDTFSMLVVGH